MSERQGPKVVSPRVQGAIDYFTANAQNTNPATRAGRPADAMGIEPLIWADIVEKLRLGPDLRLLDIGGGCGFIAERWVDHVRAQGGCALLIDIPQVISRCRTELNLEGLPEKSITFLEGLFPQSLVGSDHGNRLFDRILCYSLLHYADDPDDFISMAYSKLAPGGRLLIGDIPNLNRKGRFLATRFGQEFDARYKGTDVGSLTHYLDHMDFRNRHAQVDSPNLDDEFLIRLVAHYRQLGCDAFILEQPVQLPFAYTREDLLLVKAYA
jgi:SAM-dependent methyltransferase